MNINQAKKIYMIGIKGVGMTMLAQFLCVKGKSISGSDTDEVFMTDQVLKGNNIEVLNGFNEKNIPLDADIIIYSTAYDKENNEEVSKVISADKNVLTYSEALGEVFNEFYGIAVTGTHGKTTISAWLGYVLDRADLSPSVMVGARVPQFNGSSLIGQSDYLIIEADEYQNKLKNYQPKVVLLNNIDYDHPDFFPTKEDYENVFIEFIKKIPKKGLLIVNYDDSNIRKIAGVNCRGRLVSYAINESADYVAHDIRQVGGKQFFKVKLGVDEEEENKLGDFSISLSGRHNISNALAVIATAIEMNIDLRIIREHLENFTGTARRAELMGEYKGAKIIDDYAHHPTEIKTTIKGIRDTYKDKKITVVFHPHTFTRTKALLDDFARSFNEADELIILDIYGSARERQGGVHSKDLINKLKVESGKWKENNLKYIPTLEKCEDYLKDNIESGQIVLLMGAGDVFRIGENLVK